MNQSLFEFLSSSNMVAYWLEKHINDQPLLGETLFPIQKEVSIKMDWIKGVTDQPAALRLSAFDSKSIRRDREGIEEYSTKMPFFKESMYVDEEMRQQLNILMNTNNNAMIEQIVARIFDDQIKLIDAALVTLERMRMEAVTTGTVTLESNGQAYSYDFGVPSDQVVDADTKWSDPKADIIGEVSDFVTSMKEKGVTITRAICNTSVAKNFRTNDAIKNSIYVLAGGAIPSISLARALSYIYEETGVEFYVYDNVWVDEDKQAHKYVPDNTVVFLPDGELGKTHLGVTPEESDLMASNVADVSIVNVGIAVTNSKEVDPVKIETKVSMIGLPSLERANEILILDTEGA